MYQLIQNQLRAAAESLRNNEYVDRDELGTLLHIAADIARAHEENRLATTLANVRADVRALEGTIETLRHELRDQEVRNLGLGFKINRRDELIYELRNQLIARGEIPPGHTPSLKLRHLQRRLEELERALALAPTSFTTD